MERLRRMYARRVAVFKTHVDRRCNHLLRRRAHGVKRAIQRRVELTVSGAEREGQRLAGQLVLDEFLRLALLIEILLESPAFEASASIREDGNHVTRLNAHVALGGVADERRRGGGSGHWCGGCLCGAWPGRCRLSSL